MNNENNKTNTEDEISLKELILKIGEWWRFLWSKKWIIIAFGIIGAMFGIGYSFLNKPVYTATTTFVLETNEKSGIGQYAGIASMIGIDLGSGGGGIFQGDNIIELYKSRAMIEKTLLSSFGAVANELLIDRFIVFNKLRENWKKKPKLYNLKFINVNIKDRQTNTLKLDSNVLLRDSILREIVESINKNYLAVGKPDKKLSIIKVDVKSKDDIFAKVFNEELVKNVNDFYVQTKTKKMANNVHILQYKTDSVRAVMNGDIYLAAGVADATPNLNPTRLSQRIAPIQKAQFSAETNKMVLGALVQNLEMAKITLLKETPLIQVVDTPILPLKQEKTGKIKAFLIGGFLFGFIAVIVLLIRRTLKSS